MIKLCHVITPWRSGPGSIFGWFSETLNQALSRVSHPFWAYSPHSCPNLGIKRLRIGQNRSIFPRFWSRDFGVIGRPRIFLNYPTTQFRSLSPKPVVEHPCILFGSSEISPARLSKKLSPLYRISYSYIVFVHTIRRFFESRSWKNCLRWNHNFFWASSYVSQHNTCPFWRPYVNDKMGFEASKNGDFRLFVTI